MSEPKDPRNQIMTIKEVSRYLRIPVSTVYELTRAGKINGRKFGKHWRFLEEDIVSYFHGNSIPSALPGIPLEHRQHPRINMKIRAEIATLLSGAGTPVKGMIHNLSAGGVYFVADAPAGGPQQASGADDHEMLKTGDPVRITFELPDVVPARIEGHGRIVHQTVNGRTGSGIKFKNLSAVETELIQNYVG